MPLYDFKCPKCGSKSSDVYCSMDTVGEVKITCACGVPMKRVYFVGPPDYGFKPYLAENVGHEPIEITSHAMKRDLLKKHGLIEAG